MEPHKTVFVNDKLVQQYKEIPDSLVLQLDAHYDTFMSAVSMRKAPFPAHRNRGVSIRVEDWRMIAVVHAIRVKDTVEIHDISIKMRNEEQQEDYLVQQEVHCPFCKAERGDPCKAPNGTLLTYTSTKSWRRRTHGERRRLRQTGVELSTRIQKGKTARLFASGIRNEIFGGDDPKWRAMGQSYRNMFDEQSTADGLIDGAVRVLEKHHPSLQWSPSEFLSFMCDQVSGPHADIQRLLVRTMTSAYNVKLIDAKQFEYFKRAGVMAYADFAGMGFAPHSSGGFVAVRGLTEL
jgi:hypothetical protein